MTNTTALPGMLEGILQRTRTRAAHLVDVEASPRLTGIGIDQLVDLDWSEASKTPANWRTSMTELLESLA